MNDLIRQAAADIVRRRDDVETIVRMFCGAVAREREACAKIANKHTGSAAAKRRASGKQFKFLHPDAVLTIEAEERGEDIASEMIAKAIRARTA